MQDELFEFIVFEGNIGTGKTSLATKYADHFNYGLILEAFQENEFLETFYQNPDRHALPLELWFMAERYKQMEDHFSKGDLFKKGFISDYIFPKTLLFAKNNLNENEFQLFKKLFDLLDPQIPSPDLMVYLHRPINVLVEQIKKRGRSFEQGISEEYLESIASQYEQYMNSSSENNILYIHCGNKDFIGEPKYFERILDMIERHSKKGMEIVEL